jgi:hypothetical protein
VGGACTITRLRQFRKPFDIDLLLWVKLHFAGSTFLKALFVENVCDVSKYDGATSLRRGASSAR